MYPIDKVIPWNHEDAINELAVTIAVSIEFLGLVVLKDLTCNTLVFKIIELNKV